MRGQRLLLGGALVSRGLPRAQLFDSKVRQRVGNHIAVGHGDAITCSGLLLKMARQRVGLAVVAEDRRGH